MWAISAWIIKRWRIIFTSTRNFKKITENYWKLFNINFFFFHFYDKIRKVISMSSKVSNCIRNERDEKKVVMNGRNFNS